MSKVAKGRERLDGGREAGERGEAGDRRNLILDVARRRFAEVGFEATTMRQIADEVGILAGSLYYHFETKEVMLHEIVRDAVVRLQRHAETIVDRAESAEARLVALVFADVHEKVLNPEVFAILQHERTLFRQNGNFAYVMAARKAHYMAWRRILAEGIAEGLFNPTPAEHLTISTIIRMLNTGADWYRHEDNQLPDAPEIQSLYDLGAFYVNFVLHAIRVPARAGLPIEWPERDWPA